MEKIYKGFTFVKTGKNPWDWRCEFNNRYRWGTVDELISDVDLVLSGIGLPAKVKGFA